MAGGTLTTTTPSPWVPVPDGSGFGMANLPFGVGAIGDDDAHVVVAIGDHALDLDAARRVGVLDLTEDQTRHSLDGILADLPTVRGAVAHLLGDGSFAAALEDAVVPRADLVMRLPFTVADYVDFYSSEVHATTVGRLFRPDGDPLPRAWRHLPIGYHGRSGTVTVSGTPVRRPAGQRLDSDVVTFGPTRKLDFELELGAVIGRPSDDPVAPEDALDHVAGLVVVNDWSARDIQAFEYQPLGPFLGKSFATTISPWVVPLGALEPFRAEPPIQDPSPLDHLLPAGPTWSIDLVASVNGAAVARASATDLYWTVAQQVAHLTSNGATLRTGDLLATGTISAAHDAGAGCLLEATADGASPIRVGDDTRTWLEDGDTVTLTARCADETTRIDFGECTATVLAPDHKANEGDQP